MYIDRAALVVVPSLIAVIAFALHPPRCPIAHAFHVPCPGCGLTRATRLLAAGDVAGSLALHPLLVPMVLALVTLLGGIVASLLFRGNFDALIDRRLGRAVLVFSLAVSLLALLLWALRFAGFFGGPVHV